MLSDLLAMSQPYLVTGYTDLRRGIDGLAGIIQGKLNLDPYSSAVFLFCGRRRDRIHYYIIYRVKVCGVAGNVVFIGIWNIFRLSGGTRAFRQSGGGKRRGEDGCWWREKIVAKREKTWYTSDRSTCIFSVLVTEQYS